MDSKAGGGHNRLDPMSRNTPPRTARSDALVRAALLLVLLAAIAFPAWLLLRPGGRHNLIVILVDTLRADRLACYGHSRDTSPAVDALAREGVVFEECFASVPWTPASTATLLTGLAPFTHGFTRPEKAPLAKSAVTLAEVLRGRGYVTAGFSGNLLIGKISGFDQGAEGSFETVTWGEARQLNDLAIPWLREHGPKGRFFLYLHYFDPHDPYDDPDGLWKRYAGLEPGAPPGDERCPKGDIEEVFQLLRGGKDPGLSEKDLARLRDRYDGEIRHVDAEIGKVLSGSTTRRSSSSRATTASSSWSTGG
jgi:arylsulfatase A-like enzyme